MNDIQVLESVFPYQKLPFNALTQEMIKEEVEDGCSKCGQQIGINNQCTNCIDILSELGEL